MGATEEEVTASGAENGELCVGVPWGIVGKGVTNCGQVELVDAIVCKELLDAEGVSGSENGGGEEVGIRVRSWHWWGSSGSSSFIYPLSSVGHSSFQ